MADHDQEQALDRDEGVVVDAMHLQLVNQLISTINGLVRDGHDPDLVASASIAAVASFTYFNVSEAYKVEVDDVQIMACAAQFSGRMREVRGWFTSLNEG